MIRDGAATIMLAMEVRENYDNRDCANLTNLPTKECVILLPAKTLYTFTLNVTSTGRHFYAYASRLRTVLTPTTARITNFITYHTAPSSQQWEG
jgi:hypothetical protein